MEPACFQPIRIHYHKAVKNANSFISLFFPTPWQEFLPRYTAGVRRFVLTEQAILCYACDRFRISQDMEGGRTMGRRNWNISILSLSSPKS